MVGTKSMLCSPKRLVAFVFLASAFCMLGAFGDGLPLCGDGDEISVDVTIVGGGLAGLFAALYFEANGISYHVLEADQWGGRLRSFESEFTDSSGEKLVLEAGAQFMYGTQRGEFKENPIWKLFQEYGVDTFIYDVRDFVAYRKNGSRIRQKRVRRYRKDAQRKTWHCLDKAGTKWFNEYASRRGTTSPDQDAETTLETCKKPYITDDDDLREAFRHAFFEQEHGEPASEISRAAFPEDSYAAFGTELFTQTDQEGTSAMIDRLLTKLDGDSLTLGAKVTKVVFASDTEAKTTATIMSESDTCEQNYSSMYTIVTVPQAVFKGEQPSNVIEFSPDPQIASHPIETNVVEKLFLQFDRQFWADANFHIITNRRENGAASFFVNFNYFLPTSNIIMCFVAREEFERLGLLDAADPTAPIEFTQEIVDQIIIDLKNVGWTEDNNYTWHATEWHNNEYYGGSWEFWRVGAGTYEDYNAAIQPVDRLHKAGAAHCMNFWGFTWAAIMSGIWNAEWIQLRLDDPSAEAPYTPCEERRNYGQHIFEEFYAKYGDLFTPP